MIARNPDLSARTLNRSAAVKARLDYPVIDSDLHTVEFGPLLLDYIDKYGGAKVVDQFRKHLDSGLSYTTGAWYNLSPEERRDKRFHRPAFWILPTQNHRDLATVSIPSLLDERLEEQGTDFAVLYPNIALFPQNSGREDLRRALSRAINHYHADIYRKYRGRLSPVASIPLHNPQEGIEELEFAVKELGFKTIIIPGAIRRPVKAVADKYPFKFHPEVGHHAQWLDFYGLDSEYDYDPFWAKAIELGVNPTTHSGSQGWHSRASISNYMNNHIGHFADANEALAKSLFFSGVTRRFPKLRVGLLEGGANWAASVYAHLVDRFQKRGPQGLDNYNPDLLDGDALYALYLEHGKELFGDKTYTKEQVLASAFGVTSSSRRQSQKQGEIQDFAASGVTSVEEIRDQFVNNFYVGNEADDRTVAAAFNTKVNPLGAAINAYWSSDTGHWDVPDLRETLAETWDLVEEGVITEANFKALVYENPHRFYTANNPEFFKGTHVEAKLKKQGLVA